MEGEMNNFVKVWVCVFLSLLYCYKMGRLLSKRIPRLLAVLPIVCLFLLLPLQLSSVHLGGTTAFFVAWLANFKLLLFAFERGPLCSEPPLSLGRFVAVACLPIKIHASQNTHGGRNSHLSPNSRSDEEQKQKASLQKPTKGQKSPLNYAVKGLLIGLLLRVYEYSDFIHPKLVLIFYGVHIYCFLEITLAMAAYMARALLSIELEPQFDEPYLSTSLQDFWGRRWNIMVSRILRPTVYDPALNLFIPVFGRRWATCPAVFLTFVVSAFMHELIFYYLGRVRPTWEITWFFLLHGLCLMAEIGAKKAFNGKFQVPRLITGTLAVGFVIHTGLWLFFPPLLRCDAVGRARREYEEVGAFVKGIVGRRLHCNQEYSPSNLVAGSGITG